MRRVAGYGGAEWIPRAGVANPYANRPNSILIDPRPGNGRQGIFVLVTVHGGGKKGDRSMFSAYDWLVNATLVGRKMDQSPPAP